jgi:hypothetical protein
VTSSALPSSERERRTFDDGVEVVEAFSRSGHEYGSWGSKLGWCQSVLLKHADNDGYLEGVIKTGACEVGGVLNELPAFQRLERYPRVLGVD